MTDAAGQTKSVVTHLNIDKTAPGITANVTPAPVNGIVTIPSAGAVTVSFTCADALSGIATCPPAISVATPGANQSFSGTTIDVAGNNSVSATVNLNVQAAPLAISASLSAQPNRNGWYKSDVTLNYQCSGGVPPLQCPTPQPISSEGFDQQITGTVTDAAGQTKSAITHLNVDKTSPTITVTVTPAPVNGIVTIPASSPAIVSFTCSDVLSGIDNCPSAISITTPGANQSFSGSAIDKAGNSSAPATVTFSVQAAPLAISGNIAPPPNAAGWNNADETVSFQAIGGVPPLQISPTQVLSIEGANQSITGSVTDAAGQTVTKTVPVNLDQTPPTITATVTPAPVNGVVTIPTGGAVTVSFTCSDALSGIATCPADIPVSTPGVNQSFSGTAVDKAGNSSVPASVTFSVQAAPLAITASLSPLPNTAGWNNSDVTVSFQGSGGVPPLVPSPPQTVSTEGANQSVTGSVTDAAGQAVAKTVPVNLDKTPPTITASVSPQPNANNWIVTVVPVITFNCSDAMSGLAICPPPQIGSTDGPDQTISGTATDIAGNSSNANVVFNLEFDGPAIHASVTPAPNNRGWNNSDVTVSFQCDGSVSGGVQCPGQQTITIEGDGQVVTGTVADLAGKTATTSVKVKIDKTPPVVKITSPLPGTTVSVADLALSGTATDNISSVASVMCNGTPATLEASQGVFTCPVTLSPGPNTILILVTDFAGNTTSVNAPFALVRGPVITITSPSPLSLFSANPVTISGTIDDPQAAVVCNGIAGTISGNNFTISGVNLREAKNLLTATATNVAGGTSTATVTVYLDTTPPQVHIDSPSDGATVNASEISVIGNVNDLVGGTVNGDQVSVTVNGVHANVANRSFAAQNVTLVAGKNTVAAIATDRAGNMSQHQIQITLADVAAAQHLIIVSGNNQTAPISTMLPQPLIVQAVDASGNPLPNRALEFRVTRSNGATIAFPQSGRDLTLQTDSSGKASVQFQLGSRSGVGANQISVTAPGFVGDAIFYANSTVSAPAQINTVSGEIQKGAVGSPLPEPLVAIITDAGGNPIPNVPVTFKVQSGGGTLEGSTSVGKTTDGDGKVFVVVSLSQEEGINNNSVSASIDGTSIPPAVFISSGVVTGAAAATTVSGIVLDNAEKAIPGATVTIKGADLPPVTSDAQGRFTITNAPVGSILLNVDGRSSTRPEVFPTLSFQMVTLPGIDNGLPGSVYLPILDADNSKMVGGDEDVVLTLKDVPGVAYKVFAHSAIFPNGDKTGMMTLSQVHADRVPMIPANGTAPTLVTTLQPPGVSFDPPVQMQVPNTSGLQPGQVAEISSFRHDLEQFVTEGTARVSADGSTITSDPGFGLHVSGWNDVTVQAAPTTAACDCNTNNNCSLDSCVNGQCVHQPDPKPCCDWEADHGVEHHDVYDPQTQCCIEFNVKALAGVYDKKPIPAGQMNDCPNRVPDLTFQRNYDGCSVPFKAVLAMNILFGIPPNNSILPFSGDKDNPIGEKDTRFSQNPAPVTLPPSQLFPFIAYGLGCDVHDECYQTCYDPTSDLNAAKDKCDLYLLNTNLRTCLTSSASKINKFQCTQWAIIYYKAVGGFGQGAFDDDQAMVCQCCK